MAIRAAAAAAIAAAMLAVPTNAQVLESLTVTLTPGSVSFSLTSGSTTNPGSQTIAVTTSWLAVSLRTALELDAYFTSAPSALLHTAAANTVDIPSSRIEVSINGGANVPFNQTVAFGAGGAGRQIFTQPIGLLNLLGNRTDNLALNINLAGYPLPADTYQGALRLRARLTP